MTSSYLISPDTFVNQLVNRGKFLMYQYDVEILDIGSLCDSIIDAKIQDIKVHGINSTDPSQFLTSVKNNMNNNDPEKSFINFQAVGVSLPNIGVDTTEYTPMYQSAIKLPIKATRGDFKITMRSSDDLREWRFFRLWNSFIAGYQQISYQDTYARAIIISTYPSAAKDNIFKPTSQTRLIRCYPKSVEGIELKQDASGNEIHTFIVEFEYEAIVTDYGQQFKV